MEWLDGTLAVPLACVSIVRSLITELFSMASITTTEAKAKAIRGDVERLITVAKTSNRENAALR